MGKLFKIQMKDNLKTLLWIWIVPLFLSVSFISLARAMDNSFVEFGSGFSVFLLFLGIGASAIIIIYKDYNRFFGKEAILYQSLPVKPGNYTWSRFFTYLLSSILILLVLMLDFWIITIASGDFSLQEAKLVFRTIFSGLGQYPYESFVFFILLLSGFAASIFTGIFCINIGSQKSFKSMGIFGPILVYILFKIISTLVVFLLGYLLDGNIFISWLNIPTNYQGDDFIEFIHLAKNVFYFGIGSNIVISIIFGLISSYSQNNRLSVG